MVLQPGPKKGYVNEMESQIKQLQEEIARFKAGTLPIALNLGNSTSTSTTGEPVPEEAIQAFFEYCYPFIPIFHPPSFMKKLQDQPDYLVYAMAAYGLCLGNATLAKVDWTRADYYYQLARQKVEKRYDDPQLETLQAVLVLSSYCKCKPQLSFSFIF